MFGRRAKPPEGWREIGEKPTSPPLRASMFADESVEAGPPPLSGDERVTIERAEDFNRTRSAVLRARETHKRAERQAAELVSVAEAVLEDAEEQYRDAALALRRVSAS